MWDFGCGIGDWGLRMWDVGCGMWDVVGTATVAESLKQPDIIISDAGCRLPAAGRRHPASNSKKKKVVR